MSWAEEWGFARLVGRWTLEREIPGQGRMTGSALFEAVGFEVPGGERLAYHETGLLQLQNGTQLRAEQRYVYELVEMGFAVRFPSGELFHTVLPVAEGTGWLGVAEHQCKADGYASKYRFEHQGGFSVQHQVVGPRKDYRVVTRYIRA